MAEMMKADMAGFRKAAALLQAGELVVLPTDTVYGLAGLANSPSAIEKIYQVKSRPGHKALSVVVFAPEHANRLVRVSPLAQALMDVFWPGALTLVLPALNPKTGNLPTFAVRCPDINWTSAFLDIGFAEPLVLPSANISGQPAPITATQVQAGLGGKIPLILDGGTCNEGHESTIISIDGKRAKLLRTGAIAPERFAAFDMDLV